MKSPLLRAVLICLCISLAGDAVAAAQTWRKLPRLPRYPGEATITGMGVDSGGTLWVMTNTAPNVWSEPVRKLFWWDGAEWQEPKGAEAAPDADAPQLDYDSALYGGASRRMDEAEGFVAADVDGKRGLYAVRWDTTLGREPDEPAKICELLDGKARVVAEVTHTPWLDSRNMRDAAFEPSGLYVAPDGRLVAYGQGFLEMRFDDEWKLLARPKQSVGVSFVEQGGLVHIVYDRFLCTVSPDGTNVTRELDGLTDDELGCADHAILWGKSALLVFTLPRPKPVNLHAYDVESGKPIDIDEVTAALKDKVVVDAVRGPDGSAWILPVDAIFANLLVMSTDNAGSLRVLTPDGDLFELDELRTVAWWYMRSRSYPRSTLVASDGTFWFAPSNGGLLACRDNVFTRYPLNDLVEDADTSADLAFGEDGLLLDTPRTILINFLAEAPDGTIYAASSDTVYVLASHSTTPAAQ